MKSAVRRPVADPLAPELGEFMERHGLNDVVLVSSTDERVRVNSSGNTDLWLRAMRQLAERLLVNIDDGKYDPTVDLNTDEISCSMKSTNAASAKPRRVLMNVSSRQLRGHRSSHENIQQRRLNRYFSGHSWHFTRNCTISC
jgi:hypothetical protein